MVMVSDTVDSLRQSLVNHPVYRAMNSPARVVVFMERHVWAVWDFMSLLKALQARLTCVAVPWIPPADTASARLVNSIVLGEESDDDGEGGHCSHFDLYLRAMRQAGADTGPIDRFVALLAAKAPWEEALEDAPIPDSVKRFVRQTLSLAAGDDLASLAAGFTIGREDLIPRMFPELVRELAAGHPGRFDRLVHYLKRHIEVDGGEHGPAAARLLAMACRTQDEKDRARRAAEACLRARLELWDGILRAF